MESTFITAADYDRIMTKIAPSMLSCDFSKLGEEIERVERAGADWIHLDVMDGMFVPNLTFGAPVIRCARPYTKLPFDVHLMIEDPVRYIENFAKAGADIITVHSEAKGNIECAIDKIKDFGLKTGITLNPGTPILDIERYLDKVDLVLIMTVNAGFGGQKFRPECLSKIEFVKNYAEESNPHLEISVDGGITRETGKMCADAGATVLVAGSSLFKLDNMKPEIDIWHNYGPNAEI